MITAEEIKGLESERNLLVMKINKLREALVLETDPSDTFRIETDLAGAEARKREVDSQISSAYNLSSDSGKSLLRTILEQVRVTEDMGPIHLVNCNREALRDRFWESFDKKKQYLAHFYFLSACPTQLPPSFGERMVYEIFGELLETRPGAVYYQTDPRNADRILVHKLPLGYSEEKSKEMFREFCSAHFSFENDTTLDFWMTEKLPRRREQYIILPFYLRKKDWKDFCPTYFKWIAEQCNLRQQGGPTLLFFFITYHDNLHRTQDEQSSRILQSIDAWCAENPAAGHYYPLEPVAKTDVRDWFMDLGENNPARLDPVFDTLRKGLREEDLQQYDREQKLNMDDVEIAQEMVYQIYNK